MELELFKFMDQMIKCCNFDYRGRVPAKLYWESSTIIIPVSTMNINGTLKRRLVNICLNKKIDYITAIIIKPMDHPSTWVTVRLIDERLSIFCKIKLRSSEILLISSPPC